MAHDMDGILSNLRTVSAKPPYQYTDDERSAAVLVVLGSVDGVCHVLLNRRSEQLRRHPGQVCFPGGMREDHDTSVEDTALRECEEETGLSRDNVSLVSVFPTVRVYLKALPLTPVICVMAPDTLPSFPFNPNPDEVADIFHVPLEVFLAPIVTTPSSNSIDDAAVRHTVESHERFDIHHFDVRFGERRFDVEGLTAHICICLAIIGLGKQPDFKYRLPKEHCVFDTLVSETISGIVQRNGG